MPLTATGTLPQVSDMPLPSTPSAEALLSICRRLTRLRNSMRGPSPKESWYFQLRHCFDELDEQVRQTSAEDADLLLQHSIVKGSQQQIRQLRAYYEGVHESILARQLLSCAHPGREIENHMADTYPVTAIHSDAFKKIVTDKKRCLLIGCGPMPSTALLLLEETDLTLHCIDRRIGSCRLGERIVGAVHPRKVAFETVDAMDIQDFKAWDVIFVSALAGVHMEDEVACSRSALMDHLFRHTAPGTLMALRSAYGLARLIYPAVDPLQFNGQARKTEEIAAPVAGRSSLVLVER